MQCIIFAVNSFRKEQNILILRTENDSVTLEGFEILRRCQAGCYPKRTNRNIGNIVCAVNKTDARVLDTECLHIICRAKSRRILNLKVDAIGAACQP